MEVSLETKDLTDYLNFLKNIQESHICDKDEIYLKNALRRYETLWIPLLRQHGLMNEPLKPPLDIHWMWHLHFHNPYAYKKDLKINWAIPDHGYCRRNVDDTREVWKREYPLEPYEPPFDHEEIKSFLKDFTSSFSYDLIEASKRQKGFYYQVSLPHYRNNQFQRKCIERYQKFLKLKSMYPREFMVPFFDIDLAWHAHMSKPMLYENETSKVLGGEMLDHNDSVNKRTLEDSHKRTSQLWKDVFSEDYEIPGVVHRGECPNGKLLDIPTAIKASFFFNGMNTRMKLNPMIFLTNQVSSKVYEYELDLKVSECNFIGKNTLLNIKEIPYSTLTQPKVVLFRVEEDINFFINDYSSLLLEIDVRRKLKRKGVLAILNGYKFSRKYVAGFYKKIEEFDKNRKLDISFKSLCKKFLINLQLDAIWEKIDSTDSNHKIVNILAGSYYDCIIPENIQSLWGPIPMRKLPSDQDNNCKAVVHTIVDKKDDTCVFTVHLVHSLNLGMSCVQVFYGENRMSVAHLIGPETLSISHINEFNRFKNSLWRAMIIKDNKGDWGLLVGHWTGALKPTMTKSEGFKPGSPGYFSCSFMSLRHNEDINFKLPNKFSRIFDHEEFSIHIPNKMSVNLVSGEIVYYSGLGDEVIQYTTLSFAISVLYLLVLPTPKDLNSQKPNLNDKFQPLYFKSLYPSFFVYCGIKSIGQMPANSTIYHLRNKSNDDNRFPLLSSYIPNFGDGNLNGLGESVSCDLDIPTFNCSEGWASYTGTNDPSNVFGDSSGGSYAESVSQFFLSASLSGHGGGDGCDGGGGGCDGGGGGCDGGGGGCGGG